ncbi:MAG: glycogen synthase GlgA [Firmicutes bacterium]|nr:glycogen synthase GlgA [Bacillota bacterium]
MQLRNKLKILFVSAEVSPFAKTGGLADVAGSLPKALTQMGNDVRIVMPRYRDIAGNMKYVTDFPIRMGNITKTCIIRETEMIANAEAGRVNVPAYFVDSYDYYDREGIYCHPDDGERFAFFCNAVIEMLPKINFKPDIIHCNDWHTGPICMLLKEKYAKYSFYSGIATLYTIHNLEYQGNFPKEALRLFNIGDEVFIPDKVEFYGMFNFMKSGLVYADIINTVSETYAKEIQTPQYGERLEGLLKKREKDLYGIVNGISYEEFNPSTDKKIYTNYDKESLENKKENKYALQKETGLPVGDMPVIGLVSRLSGQKGLDLIIEKIDEIMKNNLQFILLGTGDPYYESSFLNIRNKYMNKMAVYIEFNTVLAQRIYAGSDMFLMPSRFEPCGLGQIIALRYGTIPIVRATGGLAETITDYYKDKEKGNGFSFTEFSSDELLKTIEGALTLYNQNPEEWKKLVKRAMGQDFSWKSSAEKYMELYCLALKKQGGVICG